LIQLSFKDQKDGAEGLRISNCTNITLEDFTIEDAVGDNIKVMDTDGITFRRIKAAWTGPITTENGSYGLYPVICKNVLIEECEAMGSSDAGIYVGQSEKVIIRNNKAYQNVAGIEIENCSGCPHHMATEYPTPDSFERPEYWCVKPMMP